LLQHLPITHVLMHLTLHIPQFIASVCVFVHFMLQLISPVLQQVPMRQRFPLQSVPHIPQFVLSD
jgi:hypothetical protein